MLITTPHLILPLCVVILACSCFGIFLVRMSHPLLRGLTWLGVSFASGGVASLLIMRSGRVSPLLSLVVGDQLVLLSFVLVHAAVLEFVESKRRFSPVSAVLMAMLAAVCLAMIYAHPMHGLDTMCVDFTVAMQVLLSARVLLRCKRPSTRKPVLFFACLLIVFAAFNLLRCAAIGLGGLRDPILEAKMQSATYLIYLIAVMGAAFSFFWMAITMVTAKLEDIASTDVLTGIPNRRFFLMWCEKELARVERTREPFSLLLLDLDHFKQVNDRYGHVAGDEVLCAAVQRMKNGVRSSDMLARWGGEEFSVLLPNTPHEVGLMVAERIRASMGGAPFVLESNLTQYEPVSLTISIGLVTYQGANDSIAEMLARADRRLYQAKSEGRNRVCGDPLPVAEMTGRATAQT